MPKNQRWFWLTALFAAWSMDFLLWQKNAGIAFFIWIVILLGAGYLLAWREGKKPSALSIILTVLILFFASVIAWRKETFTGALSVVLSLGGLILLAATFLSGHWPWYRLKDYVVEFAKVVFGGFSGAIWLRTQKQAEALDDASGKPSIWRRFLPVLRGVLIALPIVAIFGLLLSSADPVFGDWLKKLFDLEKLPEYIFRLIYILLIAGFLVGVYLRAIYPQREAVKPAPETPWMKPFLGWTESGIILGAVNLLFIAFVIIQVRYLFGGQANITETAYTYAEYARRGFGELIAVAVISLGLYLILSTITKREKKSAQVGSVILSVLLMVNVLVLLSSSFQRLVLYEQAYGFSQLRTYTHIFIFWLAGLIVAAVVLEILNRRGRFALALLISIVGFGLTLTLINVDGFIVKKNVARGSMGEEFDRNYVLSLSADAVPALIKGYADPGTSQEMKESLGIALSCRVATLEDPEELSWQEFNLSHSRAYRMLQESPGEWNIYLPYKTEWGEWAIKFDGEEIPCTQYNFD